MTEVAGMQSFLKELKDKEEIKDRLLKYIRGIDRFDENLIRQVFHPDAVDNHGTYQGDVDGLVDWVRSRVPFAEQQQHHVTNCLIEVFGDRALAETYSLAYHRFAPGSPETHMGAVADSSKRTRLTTLIRYVDCFERRDGEWRISNRTVVMEDSWPNVADVPPPNADEWRVATRDQSDPVWAAREWATGH